MRNGAPLISPVSILEVWAKAVNVQQSKRRKIISGCFIVVIRCWLVVTASLLIAHNIVTSMLTFNF